MPGIYFQSVNVHEIFFIKITYKQMKKILWESVVVPTVNRNFGYFIKTKFLFFTGEIYIFVK